MSLLMAVLAAAAPVSTPAPSIAPVMVQSDIPGLVTSEDYPLDAAQAGRSVAATVEIRVDPNGRPIGCSVVQALGDAPLAEQVCTLAMRRRYGAARLMSGAAAHARVVTLVRMWVPGSADAERVAATRLAPDYEVRLGALPGNSGKATDVRMVLETNRAGKVTQCGAMNDAQADLAAAICKVRTIFHTEPFKDGRGSNVAYVTEATVRVYAGE